jgi:acyl-coenzyme A thioesterase PaaI-like protein
MTVFDEATAVRRRSDGVYETHPDQRFALVAPGGTTPAAVNGGVLIATVLRAVLDRSPLPHPVATSAHFLRIAKLAPAEIRVTWLKTGRTAATARATLVQDGEPVLETTVTTGAVPRSGSVSAGDGRLGGAELSWTGSAPVLPPLEDCVELGPWRGTVAADGTAGYAAQIRMLFDPAVVGWVRGQPSGLPEMRGYFGLRENREPDALLLALAVDGLPPVVFDLGATGWAPTVELTMHMRKVPSPGVLRVAARCRQVSGGWFDEEAEVWDSAGSLVAQSRQIARVGRGRLRGSVAPAGSASG